MKIRSTHENILFMLGHFATDICHGSIPVILAYMYQAGRLDSYSAVALLMMANTLLNAVVQPFAGLLVDRSPRPYLMSVGLAMSFGGLMFLGVIENQLLLYVLIGINGLGSALFHPAGGKMAHTFGKAKLGKNMSIFSVGGNAGMAAGPFYFTACYVLFGLPATLCLCLPGLIMIAIYARKNRYYTEICTLDLRHSAQQAPDEMPKENLRGFAVLLVLLFLRSAGWYSFVSFLPLYYMHNLQLPDEIASLLNGVVCLCGVVATFLGGTVSDKIGFNRIIRLSSLLSVPFVAAFTFCTGAASATLFLIPFSFLYFAAMSPCVAIGQKFLSRHVGMATGFTIGLAMSFGGLIAPLMGALGDHYGIHAVMVAVSGFILAASLVAQLLPQVPQAETKKTK